MRPEEIHNKEKIEKKEERLTEIKNKFSLLKDKMPNTISEEARLPRKADMQLQNWPKKKEELNEQIE